MCWETLVNIKTRISPLEKVTILPVFKDVTI